jgi:ABC-type Fe3+ transport system substrate-binding protein
VTGISPDSGEQAETVDVTITGTDFIDASDVSLGAGITVNSFTVDSDTMITARITIAPNAIEAARDVSVTSTGGTGTGSGIFTVTWPAALDAIIAAAEAEGVLNIVMFGGWRPETLAAWGQAMEAKYGIDIELNGLPGPPGAMPQLAQMLIQEYQAGESPSTDVFFGAETHLPIVYGADILQSFNWKELFPYMPDESIQLEGTAIEIDSKFIGVTYNTNLVSEDEAPKLTRDVLGKGWNLSTTIYAAGFDRMALLPNWGYEGTKAFLEDLSDELTGLVGCDDPPRVASGEFTALILDCGERETLRLQDEGAPVAQSVLEDLPLVTHDYLGIPKHSQAPNLAALLTGFLLTEEGQQIYEELGKESYHVIEGTHANERWNDFVAQGVELFNATSDLVYENLAQLGTWRTEFQAIIRGS